MSGQRLEDISYVDLWTSCGTDTKIRKRKLDKIFKELALDESQAWSRTARGCKRISFLVRFSRAFKALLKIGWKLKEGDVVEEV